MYLYEYLLTLAREVKYIWRRKASAATALFVINRYVVFANRLIRLIQAVSWTGFTEKEADKVRALRANFAFLPS